MTSDVRAWWARPLTLLAALGLVIGAGLGPAAAAAPALPTDPAARGYIGLCDEAGRNVVGGSTLTRPLAWKAIASQPAPAAYRGPGQNAVLGVYQPRPGVQPGLWSGLFLTAATFYSSPKAPMAQETYQDPSMADVMKTYPPLLNGLFVLRMHYGKQNYGTYDRTYPQTVIQVQGTRWHVVQGGTVDCRAKGVSLAQITGVVTKRDLTPRTPSADYVVASGAGSGKPHAITAAPSKVGNGSVPRRAGAGVPANEAATVSTPSPSSKAWLVWIAIGGVAVLLGIGAALGRARQTRAIPTPNP